MRNCQTAFHSGWTIFRSHWQYTRVSVSTLSPMLKISLFKKKKTTLSWHEMVSRYNCDLCLPADSWYWAFHVLTGHLFTFGELSFQVFCTVFRLSPGCWVLRVRYVLLSSGRYQLFLYSVGCLFTLLVSFGQVLLPILPSIHFSSKSHLIFTFTFSLKGVSFLYGELSLIQEDILGKPFSLKSKPLSLV